MTAQYDGPMFLVRVTPLDDCVVNTYALDLPSLPDEVAGLGLTPWLLHRRSAELVLRELARNAIGSAIHGGVISPVDESDGFRFDLVTGSSLDAVDRVVAKLASQRSAAVHRVWVGLGDRTTG